MRFVMRFLSFVLLVLAVLVATVDAIQSVAASTLVVTPLGTAIMSIGDRAFGYVDTLQRSDAAGGLVAAVSQWLFDQPAVACLLSVALVLWMIAYRRPSVAGRFSA